jgi:hypothetical protein
MSSVDVDEILVELRMESPDKFFESNDVWLGVDCESKPNGP